MSTNGEKDREELAAEANMVRSRLLRTVEALDRKRHDATDIPLQIQRHAAPIGIAGGVVVLGVAVSATLVTHRIATRAERRRKERLRLLGRLWWHPERAARKTQGSFFAQLGKSLLLGVLSTAIMLPLKKLLEEAWEGVEHPTRASAHRTEHLRVFEPASADAVVVDDQVTPPRVVAMPKNTTPSG